MTSRLIGIDPALTTTGLCAVDFDDGVVLDWECIVTKKTPKKQNAPATKDRIRQVGEVYWSVYRFLERHPYPVVIEAMTGANHGVGGSVSGFGLGLGYAAAIAACTAHDRVPLPIMPTVVKRRCGASGIKDSKAAKEYAWQTCQLFFSTFPDPLSSIAKREAVHDAVAVCVASLSTDILEDSPT